jgi:hypothetical protein
MSDGCDDSGDAALSPETLALLRSMGFASAPRPDSDCLPNGDLRRVPASVSELLATPAAQARAALDERGVVRLDGVLGAALCAACTLSVRDTLSLARAAGRDVYSVTRDTDFGNVDAPGLRWDMYLDGGAQPFVAALGELLGEARAPLRVLFDGLFEGQDARFHEFAALISDAGAASQRVHADTVFQASGCPLYTCFVALQDVEWDMGPTCFIEGSHSADAHSRLRHARGDYLAAAAYCGAPLRCGDAVVMDSRIFHFGEANAVRRRKLLYFTLLNPKFACAPGEGSRLDSLRLSLHGIVRAALLSLPSRENSSSPTHDD